MIIDKENAPNKEIPTCIICVGSTGSGKSATISKYTRLPIQSNSGMARVTTKCSMYKRYKNMVIAGVESYIML